MKPEPSAQRNFAAEYIETFDTHKITQEPNADALRAKLCKDLTQWPAATAGDRGTARRCQRWPVEQRRRAIFRLGNRRQLPVSIAADWLTSAWTNALPHSPVRQRPPSLKKWSPTGSRIYSACQNKHLMHSLPVARWRISPRWLRARHKLLDDKGWSVEERGWPAARRFAYWSGSTTKPCCAPCVISVSEPTPLSAFRWKMMALSLSPH